METRRSRTSGMVRTEGGLLPADLLEKIRGADASVPGLKEADFGLPAGERLREAITRSWNRLVGAWAALEVVRVGAEADEALVGATRDRFLLPLFEELGFGRLPVARGLEVDGTSYPISHLWGDRVPVHLVGFGVELDRRTPGVRGAAGAAPHALVQEYLNHSDASLWGVVSNGRILRLLRDSTSLTRQAYVEWDLEGIFEGEQYAEFALLWTVLHRSRFEGEKPADCLLERWTRKAADDGTRALDKLRGGVETAIETLGAGFLAHPSNGALREALRYGSLDRQDYYRELLRLVYRLIFLFTAEERRDEATGRELLLDPNAPEEAVRRYRDGYSTARLRALAARRRGTRHGDQWVTLRRVVAALGGDGAPTVALPALGSFLFSQDACPHLDVADLRNDDLLSAVRALTTIEEDRRLRSIDYANLGAEELGSVYEGLLELHPRIEMDANPPQFSLSTAAGNERKATGSYYTPSSLISSLLDSALDPVVAQAVKGKSPADAEATLLGLSIVDPAAGSGHFLVAAAHRLAKRLAAIRTGESEPAPTAVRHALRDVIARCIYAVDINPMAIELCKVSLWLEALEPGRPLSFLDAHVKCGNSLLGVTPEVAAGGIPDAAYEPISGDDKSVARAWRDRNKKERTGQQALFEATLHLPTSALAAEARTVDALPDDSPAALTAKAARHADYEASADYRRSRAALDTWCAAFVVPKVKDAPEVTTAVVRAAGTDPSTVPPSVVGVVASTSSEFGFFHWSIEFPAVFEAGGFDVVLGNPPWERIKLQEREFFAARSPAIANAKNAAERKRMISGLEHADPVLWGSFRSAMRRAEGESHLLRDSGLYPLAGRGDINTYAVFTERAIAAAGRRGWTGIIVPSAVATDETTSFLFRSLVERQSLRSLYDFRNSDAMFRDVGHRRFKFCLLTVGPAGSAPEADLAFFAVLPDDLEDVWRHFTLTGSDFALLNPNTRTCPTFRSAADADLAKSVYRHVPVLVDESRGADGDPWSLSFLRMFDMANDSSVFADAPGNERVPLYEAKMAHQFNHRFGDYALRAPGSEDTELPRPTAQQLADRYYSPTPRYWVDADRVSARLGARWDRNWLIAWRDITNATNERTLISSVLPLAGTGHKLPIMFSSETSFPLIVANLNSFVLDWQVRQKLGGTSLTYFVLKQVPVLEPAVYQATPSWCERSFGDWLRRYVVELAVTSDQLIAFGSDLGWVGPPFRWDDERRALLRAEIEAAFFHLYGLSRDDVARVMDAFPIVRRNDEATFGTFRTRDLVLGAYDSMAAASPGAPFASRLDPPPGDPRVAHPPRGASEGPGRWLAWSEVVNRMNESVRDRPADRRTQAPRAALGARKPEPTSAKPTVSALTLDFGALGVTGSTSWLPETSVEPDLLVVGDRVRHRSFGPGMLLSVQTSGKASQLLIRFASGGERWIAFGYGLLEFEG